MSNLLELTLIGRVGKDAHYPINTSPEFITFTLAVTSRWKDKLGEKKEKVEWFNCNYNANQNSVIAKIILQCAKKGNIVYLRGSESIRLYQTAQGETKYSRNVHIHDFHSMSPKNSSENNNTCFDVDKSIVFEKDLYDELPF